MNELKFSKVESVGNDFVLVAWGDLRSIVPHPSTETLSELARRTCPRRFSIGADGLLVVEPINRDRIRLRMFNPDGSEDFCGNGLRCAALYTFKAGWVGNEFTIDHLGSDVSAEIQSDDNVLVHIGKATFSPAIVPHLSPKGELFETAIIVGEGELILSSLSTGSTHTVLLREHLPEEEEVASLGPVLEQHDIFPMRTSVIWVAPVAEGTIAIKIWERGAGETQGCGTGSAAAAVVWMRAKHVNGKLTVQNPGGDVIVDAEAWNAPLRLSSAARICYEGSVTICGLPSAHASPAMSPR